MSKGFSNDGDILSKEGIVRKGTSNFAEGLYNINYKIYETVSRNQAKLDRTRKL